MKQRNKLWCVILFVAGISSIIISCKDKRGSSDISGKTIPIITENINTKSYFQGIHVSGNIEGNKTVNLGFMVAGKINNINVDLGQNVKQNQLIASLDPTDYQIAKEIVDVQVNQTEDEYNRLKIMYERNSISESDYKKIEYGLQNARAQQKLKNKNLADTKMYAPFDAVLLEKVAETGEIISSGMPVLVLSDISIVKVNAYVPENQLHNIKIGQEANVQIGALNESHIGKIIEVSGAADITTRAFTVVIEVPNPEASIKPGMIAEIELSSNQEKSIITIPASSILNSPEGQTYVFIAKSGKAYRRDISIGSIYGDEIEVVTGLSTGESLVTGGQNKLTNGSIVSVTEQISIR
ncbi:efflux RND transporter periplasmic adaptor subunit [Chondrinema litorale]|uniref:efflux RND transporter periplasmic adaptor subunit n=1 Tax=Chondrinema litorale TaxID=2994555 RepID=UPI0025436BE6|nr:efflux RND transporter periplasmic adaptor subunit [Chondrinema litorale]UZR98526.1 efflux RND transporter periplasmic adaptor subunit [Chondrinema litorale]